jgi:hypothetical protein
VVDGSYGRLRRAEQGGFVRKDKTKGKNRYSIERSTPNSSRRSTHRPSRTVQSDDEESNDSRNMAFHPHPTPSFSMSPGPLRAPSAIAEAVSSSDQPLHVQKMAAELEVAEAELKAARLKYQYIQAKEQAEVEARDGRFGTEGTPRTIN